MSRARAASRPPSSGLSRALSGLGGRPDDDAAAGRRAGGQPPVTSRRCASSRSAIGSRSCRWERARTTSSPSRRARRLCGSARVCTADALNRRSRRVIIRAGKSRDLSEPLPRSWPSATPGTARSSTSASPRTRRTTKRIEPYDEPEVELQDTYRERPNVRRLSSRRRRDEFDDIFADDAGTERRTTALRPVGGSRGQRERSQREMSASTSSRRRASTTSRTSPTSSRTRSR